VLSKGFEVDAENAKNREPVGARLFWRLNVG
jgi:hypothetical protein